jgi:hypothetical protein
MVQCCRLNSTGPGQRPIGGFCELGSEDTITLINIPYEGFEVLIALVTETARTSETLVNFYQTTRRYNPEDSHLNIPYG